VIPASGWVLAVFEDDRCEGDPIDLIRVIGFAAEHHPMYGSTTYKPVIPHSWWHNGRTFSCATEASHVFGNERRGQSWVLLEEAEDHAPPQAPHNLRLVPS